MDSPSSPYYFKETRLNLEPSAPGSVINIRVPAGANDRNSRRSTIEPAFEDHSSFKLKNLATASSVYHRQWHDSPRSFLWRVLENGKLLSIRAVDVCLKDNATDAPLILNLNFGVPIQPGCVALSDPKEHDALAVYVLDESSRLFTFVFRPDTFRKRSAVDASLSGLAKMQSPKGLGFKQAHRMVAASANMLLITTNDGGMIRLDKRASNDCGSRSDRDSTSILWLTRK